MLQWMGGSRKKVTTSRMSTQKRQKQYFEQRRRQQQNLQMMGSDNCTGSTRISGQNPKEHRSLDILNLLNLSKNAQKCNSPSLNTRDGGETNVYTMPGNISTHQPMMFASMNATVDSHRFEEASMSSEAHLCSQAEPLPMKVLVSAPDHQNAAFNGLPSQSKTVTDPYSELSVIDLLCDDEPNATVEKRPTCEDHVSFSLEGLGKVGTETPVHSPEQQARTPSCYSQLLKDGRKPKLKKLDHVLDDFELEVDTMMQDIKVSPLSSSNFPYNRVTQSSTIAGHSTHYYDCANKNGSSISGEFFNETENSKEDIWNGHCFLDEQFDNEDGFNTSWKEPYQTGSTSPELLKRGAYKMGSYAFEDLLPKKWSSAAAMEEINMSEPQASFSKDELENDDFDCYMASGARTRARCSRLNENFNAQNLAPERDNSSWLSDESSSSTAVRGEAVKHSSSRIAAEENRKKHGNAFASARNNCSTKEEKFRSMPNPSKRKLPHYSNSILQEELSAPNSWQFEKRYVSVDRSSVATSFCQDLEANFAVFGSKSKTDPFGVFTTTPELHNKAGASSGGFKKAAPLEDSSPCSFTSNKFAFASSTSFPNAESWPISPSLNTDIQFKAKSQDAAGFHWETSSADLSVQGSISKGERKAKLQKDRCSKSLEQGEDIFMGDNELSSGKKMERDASTSNNHTQECEDGTEDTNPKTIEFLETDESPGHVEEISSSLKKSDKHESHVEKRKSNCDAETPLKYKITKEEEIRNWDHEGKNRVSGKHENEQQTSLSGQVMFKSYVFQLLCVQKVLKEACCTTSTTRNNSFLGSPGSDAIPHQT